MGRAGKSASPAINGEGEEMKRVILLVTTLIVSFLALAAVNSAAEVAQPDIKTQLLLVAHGIPPSDFPMDKMGEYFELHQRFHSHAISGHGHGGHGDHVHSEGDAEFTQYLELDNQMRAWPRHEGNDPYKFGCDRIAERMMEISSLPVAVAYNEFCGPTVAAALDSLAATGVSRIVVVTTMLTPGGNHSEEDIPLSLDAVRKKYPEIEIVYAWPYSTDQIASVLIDQFQRFTNRSE
jgi:sirohydrochlorin cobaltochelatase